MSPPLGAGAAAAGAPHGSPPLGAGWEAAGALVDEAPHGSDPGCEPPALLPPQAESNEAVDPVGAPHPPPPLAGVSVAVEAPHPPPPLEG